MIYICAQSIKEYKKQSKIVNYAKLDSALEEIIYLHKELFAPREIDFWLSLDPYSDTLIKTEGIKSLLNFAKRLQDACVLKTIEESESFKALMPDYSIEEIEQFAHDLKSICENALSKNSNLVSSGDWL